MEKRVKIGVVGAGVFGGYHANKCAEMPRIDFAGIFDPDLDRAQAGAAKHEVQAFETFDGMLSDVEAVVIACPARFHGQMAIEALKAGKHCLIEKPIAADLADAEKIVALAAASDLVVQIGHQERFVARAIGLDKIAERPLRIDARRMGTFSERGTDVSVTLDLMTHDLDLVHMLMSGEADRIEGISRTVKSSQPDYAEATLFYGDATASLIASRVEGGFTRTMDITYPSGQVSIDFNAKTLTHNTPFDLNADFASDPAARDSLGAGTAAFVSAILDASPVPVSAEDGLRALRAALVIDGDIK